MYEKFQVIVFVLYFNVFDKFFIFKGHNNYLYNKLFWNLVLKDPKFSREEAKKFLEVEYLIYYFF